MNTPIRTIMVDDEPLGLRGLELRLADHPDIEIIDRCVNGQEAIQKICHLHPDLVFLDIQMPGLDGFAVVRTLSEKLDSQSMPLIIFATAFDQYAIRAFEAHAQGYLLKPIAGEHLKTALDAVRTTIVHRETARQNERLRDFIQSMDNPDLPSLLDHTPYPDHLNIKDKGQIFRVEVKQIDRIDAAGDYVCLHVGKITYISRETMKALEQKLNPRHFRRIHRSAIVNLSRITALKAIGGGQYQITLNNGTLLSVSRKYRAAIAAYL